MHPSRPLRNRHGNSSWCSASPRCHCPFNANDRSTFASKGKYRNAQLNNISANAITDFFRAAIARRSAQPRITADMGKVGQHLVQHTPLCRAKRPPGQCFGSLIHQHHTPGIFHGKQGRRQGINHLLHQGALLALCVLGVNAGSVSLQQLPISRIKLL